MITIAGAIIKDEEGRILLIHRNAKRVQWEIPGGKIEEGETEEQAVLREIEEELGVSSKIVRKIGQKKFGEDDYEVMHVWFELEIEGVPRPNEDIFDDVDYFSMNEIRSMTEDCSAGVKSFIEQS